MTTRTTSSTGCAGTASSKRRPGPASRQGRCRRSSGGAGGAAALAAAFLGVQGGLAQADGAGGDLHALVVGAELQGLLQAEQPRWHQPLEFLAGGLAHVGDLALAG